MTTVEQLVKEIVEISAEGEVAASTAAKAQTREQATQRWPIRTHFFSPRCTSQTIEPSLVGVNPT